MNNFLSTDRKRDIRKLANQVNSRYGFFENTKELLVQIALGEGIALKELDLYDVSGMLLRGKDGWEIIVNTTDSETRKLFTIAHELGHYFLHRDEETRFVDGSLVFNRSEADKYNQREKEANEFAGSLIMPEQVIVDQVGADKTTEITEKDVLSLAKEFGVSSLAALTRLRNLEYTN
jgi:Zn-dependent peptidase ImmA (M78 family)